MSGWISNFTGSKLWEFIRIKTPVKYRDDLERALKKGHEVVAEENQRDSSTSQAKQAVKHATSDLAKNSSRAVKGRQR